MISKVAKDDIGNLGTKEHRKSEDNLDNKNPKMSPDELITSLERKKEIESQEGNEKDCINLCSNILDFSVCKSYAFWILMIHQGLGFIMGTLGSAFMPPLAKENGENS